MGVSRRQGGSRRISPPGAGSRTARSRVHLLFFAVREFAGDPAARAFQQIAWIELQDLPELDFLEGDLDFVKRLARGDYAGQLAP